MAEITVTSRNQASGLGNLPVVVAECASITDGDTWATGLASVAHLFVSGEGASMAYTWSESGGTITFAVTAGPLTNVSLMAIGGKV
jgi:hypothetical protein